MEKTVKILVVEDEPPLALMMRSLLSRAGHNVTVARTGQEGLELAARQPFDLITLDIDLPDIKGFEVCRELKQRHLSRRTPVIFVTGRPHPEDRQLALELGAADYLEKPFEISGLLTRIRSALQETAMA